MRLIDIVRSVLREWRTTRSALGASRGVASAAAVSDIELQLAQLLPPDFIESTPNPWMTHLPRYLMAIVRRLGRLPAEGRRDQELAARVRPFTAAVRGLQAESTDATPRPELQRLRWMIEEFRVSLFAQDLRTVARVSEQRLGEQLERARNEARG